jgi:hypothetical protein
LFVQLAAVPNIIYIRLISCVLFLICVKSQAQTTNTCGVIASISPATADSVVPLNTIINFSSTSTNATSVKWLLDDMTGYTAASFNYVVGTGVHTISLIASNGNCTDTTTVVYYCAGTPHDIDSTMFANYGYSVTNDYGTSIDNTSDNGFVLGGYSVRNGWCGADGLVVKLREKGCIEWSKKIIDTISYCPYTEVNTIYASTDGSYYVAGLGYLMKLDNNGKQQWNKKLVIDTYTFSNFSADKITGDQAGNIYLLSKSLDFGWMVTKMAPSGTVM